MISLETLRSLPVDLAITHGPGQPFWDLGYLPYKSATLVVSTVILWVLLRHFDKPYDRTWRDIP